MLRRPELPSGFQGRVFIGKIWGEGCRVCDLPLIGWWGGNRVMFQESLSSAFWFQPVWGLCACAQPEVAILHPGGGLSSCRRTLRYVSDCYVYPLRRNQDPATSAALSFFDCLFFISAFPHSSN